MTWFKVDDGFWSHPKTSTLTAQAIALWIKAGTYSCQHLTDGVIRYQVLKLLGTRKAANELVAAGLWYECPDGWEFHDWSEYQETSGDVRKRRDEARERQRKSREARTRKQRESQAKSREPSHVTENVTSEEVSYPRPDPTRPDQVTPSGVTSSSPVSEVVSPSPDDDHPMTLIPDDWAPNDLHRARNPRPDIDELAEAFRDHAISRGRRCHGRAGWDAAFSTWLRKSDPPTTPGVGTASAKAQGWLDLANNLPDATDEQRAIGR